MRQLREIGGEDAIRTFARRRIDAILTGVQPVDGTDEADVEAAAERVAAALTKAGYVTTTTRVGGPDSRRADLPASLPGVPCRRGVSRVV